MIAANFCLHPSSKDESFFRLPSRTERKKLITIYRCRRRSIQKQSNKLERLIAFVSVIFGKRGRWIVRTISSCFQCWHILCTRIQGKRQGKVKRKLAAFFTGIALFVFVTWKFIYVSIRLDRKVEFAGRSFPLHYVQWKAVASCFWHSSSVYMHFGSHVTSHFLFAPNFQRNVVGSAFTALHNDNNIQQTNRGNAPNFTDKNSCRHMFQPPSLSHEWK